MGKIVDKALLALEAPVGQLANLLRVEPLPGAPVQVLVQGQHVERVRHVDEGVPHVAVVLQVDRQVQEVVPARVPLVQALEQHFLSVLVGDVLDHHRRAIVLPPRNRSQVQRERPLLRLSRLSSNGLKLEGHSLKRQARLRVLRRTLLNSIA